MKNFDIAIVGATGLVGSTVLSILKERRFPIGQLYLLASKRSAGEVIESQGQSYQIEDLTTFDFSKTQICFFCLGNDLAAEYVPKAVAKGNVIIDKSSHYRYDPEVPLIVPEV